MTLRLPRMQSTLPLVNTGAGTPDLTFIQWWNDFANQIENSVNDISEALEAAGIAQDTADSALSEADQALSEAVLLALAGSGVESNPLTSTDAGSDATISIDAHQRTYADGRTVSVDAGTITGLAYDTLYYVFYSDPDQLGGAVSYESVTTDNDASQLGSRHLVGRVSTPEAGGSDLTGQYVPLAGLGDLEPSGGEVSIEQDGSEILPAAVSLNFSGSGVTVTDEGGGTANIAITGGGGGNTEVLPSIVQVKSQVLPALGDGITLDSPPQEGNLLVSAFISADTATSTPSAGSGWATVYTGSSTPDHRIVKRVVGPSESALQNPAGSSFPGALVIWEIKDHNNVVIGEAERTTTSPTVTIPFTTDDEYLPAASGLGLVFAGRREDALPVWSGTFTTVDTTATDDGTITLDQPVSISCVSAEVPITRPSLSSTAVYPAGSAPSKGNFILVR